jgi:EAL domain-containing protein (putative c-di-GMP-specific phosphodiesterase class I)
VIASTVRVGKSLGLTMLEPLHKPLSPADLRALLQSISRTALPIREDDLGRALTGLELVPFYQPKLRVSDRALVGVEALVRWNHPERGLLPPSEFLPLAESGPHITPLTFYMIEKAMADCVTWRARGADISVAVNVSAKSLVMEDFAERVSEIVRRSGASSSNLTLEVTETSAMADTQAILAVLTRLRIKGFSLSMDDFGTGYSSLKELHRMPFSELKVDRSFVTDMCRDRDAYTITKAIVGLGATLGLKTVAEGVETEAVMTALADVGCDVAQGYLIGKPMPPAAFLDWLNARSGVPA